MIAEIEEALATLRRGRTTGQIVVHIKDGEPRSVETVTKKSVTVGATTGVSVRSFSPTASGVYVVR